MHRDLQLCPSPSSEPLQLPSPERTDHHRTHGPQGAQLPTTLADFQSWQKQTQAFSALAAFDIGFFFLNYADEPEQIPGALVSTNLFRLLGVSPVLGRDFTDHEDRTVILTDAAWKRHFAADPYILDRVSVDLTALAFADLTAITACIAAQILPAVELRDVDLITSLKNSAAARAPRKFLVAAEVALSVVLLASWPSCWPPWDCTESSPTP